MCGIIGCFDRKNAFSVVQQGLSIIQERGKDGYGYVDGKKLALSGKVELLKPSESSTILGHALHSIVNVVSQPIKDKNNWLSANCEIYNWEELKKKFRMTAKNDAELLLKLLNKLGVEKTLNELQGVYAFAYWKGNEVTIARDSIGIKPVWFSTHKGFGFCSEKKGIAQQFKYVRELNPRKILTYNIKSKKTKLVDRAFFSLGEFVNDEEVAVQRVQELLTHAVHTRVPSKKFGVLFSGGLDSVLITALLKKAKRKFTCYVAAADRQSQDVKFARKAARKLGVELKIVILSPRKVKKYLQRVVPLIEDTNVVKVGVALPLYVASEEAKKDGNKVIFSGNGADEVFAGYFRHKSATNLIKDCYSDVLRIYERNCYRDDVVTMNNNLELRVPFLDTKLVEYGLSVAPSLKIVEDKRRKDTIEKYILRKVALSLGIPADLAYTKKKAAQYGSGFDKVIEKLAKEQGFLRKSSYLGTFYQQPNVKLAALVSSGKDSIYALYTMMRQNYKIGCMVTMKSANPDSYMFHTPTVDLVSLQSKSMNIPLIVQETDGRKEKELDDLKIALEKAKEEHDVEGVVSGALFSTYQRERIETVCDRLGLKIFSPLWHVNQEEYLRDLIKKEFRFIITKIACDGLDEKWLGKEITPKEVEKLVKLSSKNKMNVAFEGGEAESLVIGGPIFKKSLKIIKARKILENTCTGEYKIDEVKLE